MLQEIGPWGRNIVSAAPWAVYPWGSWDAPSGSLADWESDERKAGRQVNRCFALELGLFSKDLFEDPWRDQCDWWLFGDFDRLHDMYQRAEGAPEKLSQLLCEVRKIAHDCSWVRLCVTEEPEDYCRLIAICEYEDAESIQVCGTKTLLFKRQTAASCAPVVRVSQQQFHERLEPPLPIRSAALPLETYQNEMPDLNRSSAKPTRNLSGQGTHNDETLRRVALMLVAEFELKLTRVERQALKKDALWLQAEIKKIRPSVENLGLELPVPKKKRDFQNWCKSSNLPEPKEYLYEAQVEHFKVLVSKNGYSTSDALAALGLKDARTFREKFKKATGQTPEKFAGWKVRRRAAN